MTNPIPSSTAEAEAPLYRAKVLERLSSPDQIDLLMTITHRRSWFALGGFGGSILLGSAMCMYPRSGR